jgi:putative Holliday junction resolvase
MKYLGIDYGDAKVGLAIGDSETGLALPYKILANVGREHLVTDLKDVIKAEDVETVVVGMPINTTSHSSNQTNNVQSFIDELKNQLDIQIDFHDERFSSAEAKKLGAGKRDDDIAAMLMLQNYLDSNLGSEE